MFFFDGQCAYGLRQILVFVSFCKFTFLTISYYFHSCAISSWCPSQFLTIGPLYANYSTHAAWTWHDGPIWHCGHANLAAGIWSQVFHTLSWTFCDNFCDNQLILRQFLRQLAYFATIFATISLFCDNKPFSVLVENSMVQCFPGFFFFCNFFCCQISQRLQLESR